MIERYICQCACRQQAQLVAQALATRFEVPTRLRAVCDGCLVSAAIPDHQVGEAVVYAAGIRDGLDLAYNEVVKDLAVV